MYFTKSQLEKYADVLLWGLRTARKSPFRSHDRIGLFYDLEALPLAEALYRNLIGRKFTVALRAMPNPAMERDFFRLSDSYQRKFIFPGDRELHEGLNGRIYLHAPSSLTHLKSVDARRIRDAVLARRTLREIMTRREDRGEFSWTLCTFPTAALAAHAGISLREYSAQVVRACYLDAPDPVVRWQGIRDAVVEIKKWLDSLSIRTIAVESGSIDLELRLGEKRKFVGISGRNIPTFEIFTSPDWRGTRGTYSADQPSFQNGNYVEGISLRFERGRATRVSARRGGEFSRSLISMDAGACRVGEFSLTDRRFSRITRFMADTLYDENFGGRYGNCHIALGSSYSNTFSGNPRALTRANRRALGFNESALHWDLVNTENKTVRATTAGGKNITIYDKGIFLY